MNAVKNTSIALLACVAWAFACAAAQAADPSVDRPVILADWQGPLSLPPHFRNHCSYDRFSHRYLCANHCGIDYQFYYCQPEFVRLLPYRPRLLRLGRIVALLAVVRQRLSPRRCLPIR